MTTKSDIYEQIVQNYMSPTESDTAEAIINDAFHKAADSLQKLIKHPVKPGQASMISLEKLLPNIHKDISKTYYIESEIRGKITGKSFFSIPCAEADMYYSYFSADKICMDDTFKKAIMLETANIVTASAIAHFANVFKIACYAHVPSLEINNTEYLHRKIIYDMNYNNIIFIYKNNFEIQQAPISPSFIFTFDIKFIDLVIQNHEKIINYTLNQQP
ncbi:MAG: hypothetical protein NW207_03320 [Cytophagales bacterium]|nr:hypothetical protein [Cytophagales bacterium]